MDILDYRQYALVCHFKIINVLPLLNGIIKCRYSVKILSAKLAKIIYVIVMKIPELWFICSL